MSIVFGKFTPPKDVLLILFLPSGSLLVPSAGKKVAISDLLLSLSVIVGNPEPSDCSILLSNFWDGIIL